MSLEPDQLLSWNRFKTGLYVVVNFGKKSKYRRSVNILQRIFISEKYYFREDRNPKMRSIPVGDQLTYERISGAHMARLDGDSQEERLEGLITMVEDFHEKK